MGVTLRAEGVSGNVLVKGLVHGVVGGALAAAQGGNFLQGFASNAIGAGTGLVSSNISGDNIALDTAIVGAAGGVASVLTGGKFAAGFVTAAFANLFNKYAQLGSKYGWWGGAAVGGLSTALASVPADAATGGANFFATAAEIAGGISVGGRWGSWIGETIGAAADIVLNEGTPERTGDELSSSERRSIRSYEKLIQEHQQKLNDYQNDPDGNDPQGKLKDVPADIRQSIIDSYTNHLNDEIRAFKKNISDIRRGGS